MFGWNTEGRCRRKSVGWRCMAQRQRVKCNWWDWLYSKERGLSLSSELRVRCGPTAEMPDRKQEMASAAMQQLCQGEGGGRGRKEQSREVGATPQLHQHYCSLPEWGRAQLYYSESCSLLKFQIVMHWCQHKYSQLDQPLSSKKHWLIYKRRFKRSTSYNKQKKC